MSPNLPLQSSNTSQVVKIVKIKRTSDFSIFGWCICKQTNLPNISPIFVTRLSTFRCNLFLQVVLYSDLPISIILCVHFTSWDALLFSSLVLNQVTQREFLQENNHFLYILHKAWRTEIEDFTSLHLNSDLTSSDMQDNFFERSEIWYTGYRQSLVEPKYRKPRDTSDISV